jgi:hypothetical protein
MISLNHPTIINHCLTNLAIELARHCTLPSRVTWLMSSLEHSAELLTSLRRPVMWGGKTIGNHRKIVT